MLNLRLIATHLRKLKKLSITFANSVLYADH